MPYVPVIHVYFIIIQVVPKHMNMVWIVQFSRFLAFVFTHGVCCVTTLVQRRSYNDAMSIPEYIASNCRVSSE